MNIWKEREAFEKWFKSKHETTSIEKWSKDEYCHERVQFAWKAWQAAKSSAVPDGYVLDVLDDITDQLSLLQEIVAIHREHSTEHTATRDFNDILDRVTKLKAMIEAAQEQK